MRTKAQSLRPFVPSGPDFGKTLAFLSELGFEEAWRNGDLAGLHFGPAQVILQNIDVPQWQTNQMIVFEVDDLDDYWAEISAKSLEAKYAGTKLRPPTDFAWGREIHIIDPGGVCWHVRQAIARS